MTTRIALAYSGGLDTSCIVPWLKDNFDCEVFAVVGDVGQGADELVGVEKKAKNSGAADCAVAPGIETPRTSPPPAAADAVRKKRRLIAFIAGSPYALPPVAALPSAAAVWMAALTR